jgi:hypothetical protein
MVNVREQKKAEVARVLTLYLHRSKTFHDREVVNMPRDRGEDCLPILINCRSAEEEHWIPGVPEHLAARIVSTAKQR